MKPENRDFARVLVQIPCLLIGVVLLHSMFGCAGPKIGSGDAMLIEQSRASNKALCIGAKGTEATAKYAAIAKLPGNQIGMVMMAEAMVAQAAALSGKKDPCDMGMGYFEYAANVAHSQNEAVAKIVPGLATATVAGVGIVTTGDVLKTAFKNSGNQTSTTINGDSNSASHEHIQTTSNVDNNVSADGEGASTGVTNGSTTGPDQSSSTETIHEAPAAPVVE